MKERYTLEEMKQTIACLQGIFDLVRVVDPLDTRVAQLPEPGGELTYDQYTCYAVWRNKTERCANCISLRALEERERQTKYEFINNDVYYVVAQPVVVEDKPLVLEIVSRVSDSILLGAYGQNEFVERITRFTQEKRVDQTTGIFGAEYFREKLFLRMNEARTGSTDLALCLVDVDHLDELNSRFGCLVGDEVLRAVAQLLRSHVSTRRGDFAARLGGDEFALLMEDMPPVLVRQRLKELLERVHGLVFTGYDEVKLTVSIGCFRLKEMEDAGNDDMIRRADARLKQAKLAGGDGLVDWENTTEDEEK